MNIDTAREQRILDLAIKLHAGNATVEEQQNAASTLSFTAGERLGYEVELQFIKTVLFLFSRYDVHEQLFWRLAPNNTDRVTFAVNCNDTFAPAYADCEEITTENLPVLKQSFYDVAAVTAEMWYAPILFVARVRGLRVHPMFLIPSDLKEMFDACGPARTQ
jgi:hypothetical protein